jgi:hypothetical protein
MRKANGPVEYAKSIFFTNAGLDRVAQLCMVILQFAFIYSELHSILFAA